MIRVYLSLGSNIRPGTYLPRAIAELREYFDKLHVSPAYRFAAVGFSGPDFYNLAAGLDTDMTLAELDVWLHALEDRHGRRRDVPRFSSRTLDIDVVLYGDAIIHRDNGHDIPRPELRHAFVLQPLVDIAAEVTHPVSGLSMRALWQACTEAPGVPVQLPAPTH